MCTPRPRRRPPLCRAAGAHRLHRPAARPQAPRTAARRKRAPPGSCCVAHAHTRARPCLHQRVRRSVSTDQVASWQLKGYVLTLPFEQPYMSAVHSKTSQASGLPALHARKLPRLKSSRLTASPHTTQCVLQKQRQLVAKLARQLLALRPKVPFERCSLMHQGQVAYPVAKPQKASRYTIASRLRADVHVSTHSQPRSEHWVHADAGTDLGKVACPTRRTKESRQCLAARSEPVLSARA